MVHRSAHSRTKRSRGGRDGHGTADVIPLPSRKPGFENEETASVMDSPFGAEEMAPPPLPTRPKLEVVPNKSSWPFAPDNAPLGLHAAEASTDRAIAETPVKKRSPAIEKRPRPSSKLVVWNEQGVGPTKRAQTQLHANIHGVPLPPATDDVSAHNFKLRRSESVIAEAMHARAGIGSLARHASVAMRDMIAGGFEVASYIGEGSIRAVRKFEAMPRRRQIIWVATPYAVVIILVLLLVHLRAPESASATMIPTQQPKQAVRAPLPAPDPPPVVNREEAPAPVVKKEEPPPPTKHEEPPAKPEKISGTWQEVQATTWLRSMPNAKAKKVAKLGLNSKVIIFSEMPAKDGWLVAQKPNAEIGFLKATSLEPHAKKEASVKKKSRKTRRP